MSDIEALESRILAALDRIGDGVARLPEPGALAASMAITEIEDQTGEVEKLEAALAEERIVSAQLEERVKALKARQDETVDRLRSQIEEMRQQSAQVQEASERLRQVNADLRDINARLREQLSAQTAEPHLINKAMMAELEALRATRAADKAEVEAVMQELRPLIGEPAEQVGAE